MAEPRVPVFMNMNNPRVTALEALDRLGDCRSQLACLGQLDLSNIHGRSAAQEGYGLLMDKIDEAMAAAIDDLSRVLVDAVRHLPPDEVQR